MEITQLIEKNPTLLRLGLHLEYNDARHRIATHLQRNIDTSEYKISISIIYTDWNCCNERIMQLLCVMGYIVWTIYTVIFYYLFIIFLFMLFSFHQNQFLWFALILLSLLLLFSVLIGHNCFLHTLGIPVSELHFSQIDSNSLLWWNLLWSILSCLWKQECYEFFSWRMELLKYEIDGQTSLWNRLCNIL